MFYAEKMLKTKNKKKPLQTEIKILWRDAQAPKSREDENSKNNCSSHETYLRLHSDKLFDLFYFFFNLNNKTSR